MFRASVHTLLIAGLLSLSSGCAMLAPGRTFVQRSWRLFRPDPTDYRDTTGESHDQWSFVGSEGRGDRAMEKEADPLKPLLMSNKARNIERNLGID